MIKNPTIGSDVEYFLAKGSEIVSAEGIIKGTKYEPFRWHPANPFFATSLDNVLAEGNIPPAKTEDEFESYLYTLRQYMDSHLPQGLKTVALASARLDPKYLQTENAQLFGCDPSLNAWTLEEIHPACIPGETLRSAGFHIHVGYLDPNEEDNINLARMMDLFLGVPSVLIEPPSERKELGYGVAGNFRHQHHGVEYRYLSSWFAGESRLIKWAFKNTLRAVEVYNNGGFPSIMRGTYIPDVINSGDKTTAQNMVSSYKIPLPEAA